MNLNLDDRSADYVLRTVAMSVGTDVRIVEGTYVFGRAVPPHFELNDVDLQAATNRMRAVFGTDCFIGPSGAEPYRKITMAMDSYSPDAVIRHIAGCAGASVWVVGSVYVLTPPTQ